LAQSVTVNLASEKQHIRGFGGINMPGWIPDLTPAQVDKAFGNDSGQIGMSILRVRVSHDSTEFYKEIPTALKAKSHGALIIASPWTPPVHMKTNNDTASGSLKTSSYAAYAAHLKSFCDYMSKNDVPLYAISVQNEPDVKVTYQSCDWTASEIVNFIKNNSAGIGPTKLIAPESYELKESYTNAILNDQIAASKVAIIGGHIYGDGGLVDHPLVRAKGKEVWMTEHIKNTDSCHIWSSALNVGKEIHDCMAANFSAYLWWYIRRFYGMIDEAGNVSKRGYVMAQFAKFVRPGYVRVNVQANPTNDIDITAYKKGLDIAIVVLNRSTSQKTVTFSIPNTPVKSFKKYTTSSTKNVKEDGTVSVTGNAFSATFDAQSVTTLDGIGVSSTTPWQISEKKPLISNTKTFNGSFIIRGEGTLEYSIYDLTGTVVEKGIGNTSVFAGKTLKSGSYIIMSTDLKSPLITKVIKY
jgi:O-glycosyl hydrolase